MPYKTRAQLVAELTALEAKIAAAENGDYNIADRGVRRSSALADMYKRRDELEAKIESYDRYSSGGFANKVKFARPA